MMNSHYFIHGIKMINYHLATSEGSLLKRFTDVVFKILLLHDAIIRQDLQTRLDEMKTYIVERLCIDYSNGHWELKLRGINPDITRKFIEDLREIQQSAQDQMTD